MQKNKSQLEHNVKFVFFGTEPLAGAVLNELEKAGFLPALIVASQDKELRGGKIEFPIEKKFALEHDIEFVQPEKIDEAFISQLAAGSWQLFIVASYGKILPKELLDIPSRGTLNVHPSLLPKLRGASPIRSAILNDEKTTGVSIMFMDEKMDHGPLLAQKEIAMPERPMHGRALDELLAREGGNLLADTLPQWLNGSVKPREQDHSQATVCKLFKKEDGLLDLNDDPYKNLLKIRALEGWPGTFAFFEREGAVIRVQIIDAHLDPSTSLRASNKLTIDRVKPEGKGEMPYEDFLRSGAKPMKN